MMKYSPRMFSWWPYGSTRPSGAVHSGRGCFSTTSNGPTLLSTGPRSVPAPPWLAPTAPSYCVNTGTIHAQQRRFDEAEAAHERLSELSKDAVNPEFAARSCGLLANFRKDRGKFEEAEAGFEKCLEDHPTNALVLEWAA